MFIVDGEKFYEDVEGRKALEANLQEKLKEVKHKIFNARLALEDTKIIRTLAEMEGTPHYADRYLAVAEQHLNLALLALAEGRSQMRDIE